MTFAEPSFTIGVEEEYLLVDRETRDLVADPSPSMFEDCEASLGAQVSPGAFGVCTGLYSIDLNLHIATQTSDPALVAGATVDLQCWYRDPPNVGAANFTSAVGVVVCP